MKKEKKEHKKLTKKQILKGIGVGLAVIQFAGVPVLAYLYIKEHKKVKQLETSLTPVQIDEEATTEEYDY